MNRLRGRRETIYNTPNRIDEFDCFDIASTGFRALIKGLDPTQSGFTKEGGDERIPKGKIAGKEPDAIHFLAIVVEPPDIELLVRAVRETFAVASFKMRLGGYRWWFVCLGCSTYKRKLYYSPKSIPKRRLVCRECHGLKYPPKNQ